MAKGKGQSRLYLNINILLSEKTYFKYQPSKGEGTKKRQNKIIYIYV